MTATSSKKKTILLTAGSLGGIAAIITAISQICIPGILGDCSDVPSSDIPVAVATVTPSEGKGGDDFFLYGSESYDPDGGTIRRYEWKQTEGPSTSLNSLHIDNPKFTAPTPTEGKDEILRFQLTVTDDENTNSIPYPVKIIINDIEEPSETTREEPSATTTKKSPPMNVFELTGEDPSTTSPIEAAQELLNKAPADIMDRLKNK